MTPKIGHYKIKTADIKGESKMTQKHWNHLCIFLKSEKTNEVGFYVYFFWSIIGRDRLSI